LSDSPSNEETPAPDARDAEQDAIVQKFEDNAFLGDQAFLYSSWSAWSLIPKQKKIAPVSRIILGDLRTGDVLFDRPVVLTAIADLLNELSYSFLDEVTRASELEGYSFTLPADPDVMLTNLRDAHQKIAAALELLAKTDLLKTEE
jgi:hypothetical protein